MKSVFLFWEDIQYLAIFGQKYDLSCKVPAVATVIYHILYAPVVFCFISLTFLCPLILVFQSHYFLLSFIYDFLTNFPFCLKENFLDDSQVIKYQTKGYGHSYFGLICVDI